MPMQRIEFFFSSEVAWRTRGVKTERAVLASSLCSGVLGNLRGCLYWCMEAAASLPVAGGVVCSVVIREREVGW